MLLYVADLIVPMIIFLIVSYGVLMRVNVYDSFIKGAKSGFFTVIKIMPTLIGLMVAVGILRASGFLDYLSGLIGGAMKYVGFPSELVPLTVVKMFSSSAATGLLLDAYKEYGTDSYIGLVASISMSPFNQTTAYQSTETVVALCRKHLKLSAQTVRSWLRPRFSRTQPRNRYLKQI